MYPILFKLGVFEARSFWVMLFLGFIVAISLALVYVYRIHKTKPVEIRQGLADFQQTCWLGCWLLVGGIFGGHLVYVFSNPGKFDNLFSVFWPFSGGMVSFGAILGVVLTSAIFIKQHKLNYLKNADLVFAYYPLVDFFQRLGCFLNGCCFGRATNAHFGVCLPQDIFSYNYCVYRHPLPLYFSLFALLVFLLLKMIARKNFKPGTITVWFFLVYLSGRFFLEFLRDDQRVFTILPFNQSQYICLAVFVVAVWIARRYRFTLRA